MKLVNTKCPICSSRGDYKVIYKKNFNESDFNINVFSARRMPDHIHYQIVKCRNDNLLRSNPVLDESSLLLLYKKSKFTYESELENLTAAYLEILKPILRSLPKGANILEAGCGNGFILKALYDMGYENVSGVEPSSDAIAKADKAIRNKILRAALKPDTFKPDTFDLIFFFQTLDHVEDPDNFLKVCYNLLSGKGFAITVNHDAESLQAKILKEKSPIIDIEHTYFYTKETLKKIFEKNNFKPIKIYSPPSIISFRYLIWLMPIPRALKTKLLSFKRGVFDLILRQKIKIKLGNLCLIAQKAPLKQS